MTNEQVVGILDTYARGIAERIVAELGERLQTPAKEWYSSGELAAAVGVSAYTVRERWCNAGRIVCEKDAAGKWRIPRHEYERIVAGGQVRLAG